MKILGLDLGITSVGWGIIDDQYNIIDQGVRLFEESSASENVNRRAYRSSRRLKRRKKQRIEDVKNALIDFGIFDENYTKVSNVYQIRVKGLIEKLTKVELTAAIMNIAKRRGSSLETIEEKEAKEGGAKSALNKNAKELEKSKYVAAVQLERLSSTGKLRGHENIFKTDDYICELKKLLNSQKLSEEQVEKLIMLIERRRHFSEGPGSKNSPTKYGRYRSIDGVEKEEVLLEIKNKYKDQFKKNRFSLALKGKEYSVFKSGIIVNKEPLNLIDMMRGKCSVYPDEFRAPKNSFSSELFNFLNDLNNIKIVGRTEEKITTDEKKLLISIVREKGDLSPKGIKGLAKVLNIDVEQIIGTRILKGDKIISEFPSYKKYLKIFKDKGLNVPNDDVLDDISEILTKTKVVAERFVDIEKIVNDKDVVNQLSQLGNMSQYHSLSFKAIKEINDEMLVDSVNQQQVIIRNSNTEKSVKLCLNEDAILSPVAKRVHREAFKLVKELILKHGEFGRIVIETTRYKNSEDEKKRIKKVQERNLDLKRKANEILSSEGYDSEQSVSKKLALKIRMYKEQDCKCAYSGVTLELSNIIRDPESYEIDHIIPYSISGDDSYNNKVLVLKSVNQIKGNKTPFAYFSSNKIYPKSIIKGFNEFKTIVDNNNKYSFYKKANLLYIKDITRYDNLQEFKERNIIDTSYAIITFMSTLENYFKSNSIKTSVITIKGQQTSLFRNLGINNWYKNNKDSDMENPLIKNRDFYSHHAIDALIVAGLSNKKMFQEMRKSHNDYVVNDATGEVYDSPLEDKNINMYLKKLANVNKNEVKFSWKVDTKPNRSISDQTIYSTRIIEGEHVIVKKYKNIYEMESKELEKNVFSVDKETKVLMYKNDPKTFGVLKGVFNQFKHEKFPFAAYKEQNGGVGVKKYSKNGNGTEIQDLKYSEDRLNSHIDISNKYKVTNKKVVLLQNSPYRTDIYLNGTGLYKFVTVRHKDICYSKKGAYIDKEYYDNLKREKKIDSDFVFQFSLYRNTALKIYSESDSEKFNNVVRFIGTNSDKSNIIEVKGYFGKIPNESRSKVTIGKKISKIEKFAISPSGLMKKICKEDLKLAL